DGRLVLAGPRRVGDAALGREHGDLADGADQRRLAGGERSGDDDLDGLAAPAVARPAGHVYSPRTPAMSGRSRLRLTLGSRSITAAASGSGAMAAEPWTPPTADMPLVGGATDPVRPASAGRGL